MWPKNSLLSKHADAEATNRESSVDGSTAGIEKHPARETNGPVNHGGLEIVDEERPDETVQDGVKKAEATTLVWTKPTLIALFIWYAALMKVRFQLPTDHNLYMQHLVHLFHQRISTANYRKSYAVRGVRI